MRAICLSLIVVLISNGARGSVVSLRGTATAEGAPSLAGHGTRVRPRLETVSTVPDRKAVWAEFARFLSQLGRDKCPLNDEDKTAAKKLLFEKLQSTVNDPELKRAKISDFKLLANPQAKCFIFPWMNALPFDEAEEAGRYIVFSIKKGEAIMLRDDGDYRRLPGNTKIIHSPESSGGGIMSTDGESDTYLSGLTEAPQVVVTKDEHFFFKNMAGKTIWEVKTTGKDEKGKTPAVLKNDRKTYSVNLYTYDYLFGY